MNRIAIAVAAALLIGAVAAPAQAQSFGIFFGDEPSDFGFGIDHDDDRFEPELPICLSDRQIRQRVAQQGYTDISLNVPNDKHVQVRASKGGATYLLDFNYCTGEIEARQRLR